MLHNKKWARFEHSLNTNCYTTNIDSMLIENENKVSSTISNAIGTLKLTLNTENKIELIINNEFLEKLRIIRKAKKIKAKNSWHRHSYILKKIIGMSYWALL